MKGNIDRNHFHCTLNLDKLEGLDSTDSHFHLTSQKRLPPQPNPTALSHPAHRNFRVDLTDRWAQSLQKPPESEP